MPDKIAQIQNDYGVKEILFVRDRGIEGLNTNQSSLVITYVLLRFADQFVRMGMRT